MINKNAASQENAGSQEQDVYKVAPVPDYLEKNEKVAIITGDNVEDIELFYPYYRLSEEGYAVDVITPEGGKFAGKHSLGLKQSKSISDVNSEDYILLYLPGGKAPAELRNNQSVLKFVKEFADSGKPVAAVCHGPQILISADLVKRKEMAAWPEVGKEISQAGGTFVDKALVIDGQFITARKPGDLPRHLYGVLEYLKREAGNINADINKMAGQNAKRSSAG